MVTARIDGHYGITTFLSPVDAWLYFGENEPGRGAVPVRFDTVNTRHYLELTQGRLTVFITRGFAATADTLLTKKAAS